jgi:hypothetical protein
MASDIVPIGTKVKPYGRIDAVGFIRGERYYWLSEGNSIAMMPAELIEPMARQQLEGGVSAKEEQGGK